MKVRSLPVEADLRRDERPGGSAPSVTGPHSRVPLRQRRPFRRQHRRASLQSAGQANAGRSRPARLARDQPGHFWFHDPGRRDVDMRGDLGMHYTSVPNIMKVLQPLFLMSLEDRARSHREERSLLRKLLTRISKSRSDRALVPLTPIYVGHTCL
jgi:hypothetical protein